MKCELQENNITCKICGCETKYRKKFFFRHLKEHNISFKDYPDRASVDHKISVYSGYKNGRSVEQIGNIDNLCVCSLRINCMKNFKSEKEFLQEMEKWK